MRSNSVRKIRIVRRNSARRACSSISFLKSCVRPDKAGSRRRRPRVDRLIPALHIGKRSERIGFAGEDEVGALYPAPAGHVDDRILSSDDMVAPRKMLVQHAIVPLDLATIAIDRIGNLFRRGALKMHRLAGERTDACRDEEKPGEQFRPIRGLPDKSSGLVAEVQQDRARSRILAPERRQGLRCRRSAGTLPFGLTARKSGACCSPLLVSTGTTSYGSLASSRNSATFAGFGVG